MSFMSGLDGHLDALKTKVTKSRIAAVIALCVENVKSEASIVQSISSHVQRSQPQQKLGVLYAIDAVSRQWIDKASAAGEDLSSSSPQDGTFAGGVHRIKSALPVIMTDIIQSAPEDHKDKISKLVEIWERGNTFPLNMLNDFKTLLQARAKTAPIALPTPAVIATNAAQAVPAPSNISAVVAVDQPVQSPLTVQSNEQPLQNLVGQPQAPAVTSTVTQTVPAPANPTANNGLTADQLSILSSIIPADALADPVKLAQSIQVLQQLQTMGIPTERWPQILQIMNNQQPAAATPVQAQSTPTTGTSSQVKVSAQVPALVAPPVPAQVPQHVQAPAAVPQPALVPAQQQPVVPKRRSRSRSPVAQKSPGHGQGQTYRQRSPLRSNSELQGDVISINSPKWTGHDSTLPPGHIKVLSRTLFVGGVNCTEEELRNIFMRYGSVQSAIANRDKHHAFVKMCNRADAVRAKMAMENPTDSAIADKVRKTKWGVGFGPRECNNYETGESIIPLDRLTDADRKWALSAEYGGTGGKALESGMVMAEPDIEIGAGVSSKAISARRSTGNMHHNDDRYRNDRNNHRDRRNSPPRRNRNSTGSGVNDFRPHDNYNNSSSRLPVKPPQYGMSQPSAMPAPVAAFNYGQPSVALPAPTSTGFISTGAANNVVPAYGGGQQQQDWMQQIMQMGMNMGQGANGAGFSGQMGCGGYGQR